MIPRGTSFFLNRPHSLHYQSGLRKKNEEGVKSKEYKLFKKKPCFTKYLCGRQTFKATLTLKI